MRRLRQLMCCWCCHRIEDYKLAHTAASMRTFSIDDAFTLDDPSDGDECARNPVWHVPMARSDAFRVAQTSLTLATPLQMLA